jgi:hypothetical protein
MNLYEEKFVALDGLLVIVLATGSNVCGFKPGQGRWIFKDDKIHSKTSFGGEVKSRCHVARF